MIEALRKKYLDSFEDKINHIKRALESSDLQVLSALIHQLAGSSGSYGFTSLSDQCLTIEQIMMDNKDYKTEITPAITSLIATMEQVRQTNNLETSA